MSNFQMVNLCNGGTKDLVALWEIIHLNISTTQQLNALQSNLLK